MPVPVSAHILVLSASLYCFCAGCVGSKVTQRIDKAPSVTVRRNEKIALLAPVYLRHLGRPGLYDAQKDSVSSETQCYLAYVQLEPFFIQQHKRELGSEVDIIYYAENFSVTNRDLLTQSLVNLNFENNQLSFRNTHGGRNAFVINAPFDRDDRIYELNSLPAGYSRYIMLTTANRPHEFSAAKNVYAFMSALTLLMLPLPSACDFQTSAILKTSDLKDGRTLYVQQTTRKQVVWLPLILTFGCFSDSISTEEEAVKCLKSALKQIKRDCEP